MEFASNGGLEFERDDTSSHLHLGPRHNDLAGHITDILVD
jgi:hypothetical protein